MDTTDLAYAAGIIDGEGYIALGAVTPHEVTYYQPRLVVEMSDLNVISWLHSVFPVTHKMRVQERPGYKTTYGWVADRKSIERYLPLMLRFLKAKHSQAVVLLDYLATNRPASKWNPLDNEERELAERTVQHLKDLKRSNFGAGWPV
jgi:hypothetical protein